MAKAQTIVPIGEYILLQINNEEENSGTLILPNNTTESNRGIVKGIGDKVNTDSDSVAINVNDKVIFIPGTGIKLTNSEDSDIIISVKNIIGIIRGEE